MMTFMSEFARNSPKDTKRGQLGGYSLGYCLLRRGRTLPALEIGTDLDDLIGAKFPGALGLSVLV